MIRWSILEIETNENSPGSDQAYGVGFLEGRLTRGLNHLKIKIRNDSGIEWFSFFCSELISLHLMNMFGDFYSDTNKDSCPKLISFFTVNFKWIKNMISSNPNDPYWHHVNIKYYNIIIERTQWFFNYTIWFTHMNRSFQVQRIKALIANRCCFSNRLISFSLSFKVYHGFYQLQDNYGENLLDSMIQDIRPYLKLL